MPAIGQKKWRQIIWFTDCDRGRRALLEAAHSFFQITEHCGVERLQHVAYQITPDCVF
jgi:hypothetical protein